MLSKDQIINYVESRFIEWIDYLIEMRKSVNKSDYNPYKFPLDKEILKMIVTLPHEDYLRMQYYLNTKIKIHLQCFDVEVPSMENNYFGQTLLDITRGLQDHAFLAKIAEHPVYGIAHGEQMLDPAFYNWMSKHILHESVQIEARNLWRTSPSGMYNRGGPKDDGVPHTLDANFNSNGNIPIQLVNGEIIDIVPGCYYIVTESNEQCQPTAIQRYVLKNHYNVTSGNGLVGFLFKLTKSSKGVILKFLCNGLDTSNFRYDYKALGLSNVN